MNKQGLFENNVLNIFVVEDQDFQFIALQKGIRKIFDGKGIRFNFIRAKNYDEALAIINNPNYQGYFHLGIFDNQIDSFMKLGEMLVKPFLEANPGAEAISNSRDFLGEKKMNFTSERLETKPFLHKQILGDEKIIDESLLEELRPNRPDVRRDTEAMERVVTKIKNKSKFANKDAAQKYTLAKKRKLSLQDTDFPDEAAAQNRKIK